MERIKRFIKNIPESLYAGRGIWFVLLLISIVSFADVALYRDSPLPGWAQIGYLIVYSVLKATVLSIILLPMLRRRGWRIAGWIFIGIYALLSIVNFLGYLLYDVPVTALFFELILQTNPREASEVASMGLEMLAEYMSDWRLYVIIAAICFGCWGVKRMSRRAFTYIAGILSLTGLLGAGVYIGTQKYGVSGHSLFGRYPKFAMQVYKKHSELRRALGDRNFEDLDDVTSRHRAVKVVVVIGESAARNKWNAYGYQLENTPKIQAMRDSIYLFEDALTSSNFTINSILAMMSMGSDRSGEKEWIKSPLISEILKSGGYGVSWISNQALFEPYSYAVTMLSETADRTFLTRERYPLDDSKLKREMADKYNHDNPVWYDEILMEPFGHELSRNSDPDFIIVHLNGSHLKYYMRYPKQFKKFGIEDVRRFRKENWLSDSHARSVADYSNSILYTDSLLGEMVNMVARESEPSIFIYVSDHGENVFDREGDTNHRSPKDMQVPFVVYANRAYREANPDMIQALERSVDVPFSTSSLPHILMTLTGTHYARYDARRDPLSPNFERRPRYLNGSPWPFE